MLRKYISTIIFFTPMFAYSDSVNLGLKIRFDVGMSHIGYEEDFETIEELRKIQIEYKNSSMTVIGHTDSTGTDEVNQQLSEARAASVVNALIEKGGTVDRQLGYGEHAPIATNQTKEGRAKNRRVVATVYGLTYDESVKLAEYAEASERLFVISVENEKVEALVQEIEQEQEQEIETDEVLPDSIGKEVFEESVSDEPISEKKEIERKGGRLKLKGIASQSFLEANDITGPGLGVNAEWVSEFNYGLEAVYQFNIAKYFWLGFRASVDDQSYEDQTNASFTWDRENPSLMGFSLVSDYEKGRFGIGLNIDYDEYAFVIENSSLVTLEKEWILGVTGELRYLFLKGDKYSSRVGLDLILPLSGMGDLNASGNFGGASLRFDLSRKTFKSYDLFLGMFYTLIDFEHDFGDQVMQKGGIEIGIRSSGKWL
jgi:hypothetical protein